MVQPSIGRVNSSRNLYCCWLLSLWFNPPNYHLSIVLASVVQGHTHIGNISTPEYCMAIGLHRIKKFHWQPWIWHQSTSFWVVYLESSFTNVRNYLRIYLSFTVTNYNGERSFCTLKMAE